MIGFVKFFFITKYRLPFSCRNAMHRDKFDMCMINSHTFDYETSSFCSKPFIKLMSEFAGSFEEFKIPVFLQLKNVTRLMFTRNKNGKAGSIGKRSEKSDVMLI